MALAEEYGFERERPMFSVVMPAFNAASTIARAIESLRRQKFRDWELLVCDDASSDATRAIAEEYASSDSRIRLIANESNSGSAFLPRCKAVEAARGKYIVEFDADDELQTDYLAQASQRFEATDADLLIGRMQLCSDGNCGKSEKSVLPSPKGIKLLPEGDSTICGRELLALTLDSWEIPLCLIVKRELYLHVMKEEEEPWSVYSDEVLSRRILLAAKRVGTTPSLYLYHQVAGSITRQVGKKSFSSITSNQRVLQIAEAAFGRDSEEFRLAAKRYFAGVCQCVADLQFVDAGEKRDCEALLRTAFRSEEFKRSRRTVGGRMALASRAGFHIFRILMNLRNGRR